MLFSSPRWPPAAAAAAAATAAAAAMEAAAAARNMPTPALTSEGAYFLFNGGSNFTSLTILFASSCVSSGSITLTNSDFDTLLELSSNN